VITARRDGTEWVLDGAKIMAVGLPLDTHLLVTCPLFSVDIDTPVVESHGR
jgi:alkylation response protein AidB-like acyl-CoA dehydrogenase